MLWQLKKLSTNEPLSPAQKLPKNWGPIFGLENIKDRLSDLSWLGNNFSDQGWFEVEGGEASPVVENAEDKVWEQAKILLRESDWAMLPDVPMTVSQKEAWISYRASLRSIRNQPGFPNVVSWPNKPE